MAIQLLEEIWVRYERGRTASIAKRSFNDSGPSWTPSIGAFPAMDAAAHTILMQTDQILVKPMKVMALVEAISRGLRLDLLQLGRWRR
jgi:hypothetical protein